MAAGKPTEAHDFAVTRVIAAPLEGVWAAWADPELVAEWWGPQGFTGRVHRTDFREGGSTLISMSHPDFGDLYNTWTYTRIVPNERIEFDSRFADADGNPIDPLAPGVAGSVPHVVTFADFGNRRTEMRITESGYASSEAMEMSRAGQEQVVDKIAAAVERRSSVARGR
jgi:uncharacterized protein YndB with AHSA1/START domain